MSNNFNRWYLTLILASACFTIACITGCDGGGADPQAGVPGAGESQAPADSAALAPVEASELGETPNVHQVGNVITAAQPPREAFLSARDSGYRVVLDLRSEEEDRGFDERAVVEELGMEYVNPGFRSPDALTDDIFDRSRAVLRESEKKPVLMHCASANRVGGVWLTYRVLDEGVPLEKAMQEAATIGLSNEAILNKAKDYIERKQGSENDMAASPIELKSTSHTKRLPYRVRRKLRANRIAAAADNERRRQPELVDLNRFSDEFVVKWTATTRQIAMEQWDRQLRIEYHVARAILLVVSVITVLLTICSLFGINSANIDNFLRIAGGPLWGISTIIYLSYSKRFNKFHLALAKERLASEIATGRLAYCIECAYDLRATPGMTCPECGATTLLPNDMESDTNGAQ